MYHHQSLGSPPKPSLLRAIRTHPKLFSTFAGLTYELISKHLPPSSATYQGHMIRRRGGLNSTRYNRKAVLDARRNVEDMFPREQVCQAYEDEIYCFAVLGDTNEDTLYTDLTGRFPVESYEGMNCIFVAYVCKINCIGLRAMKSRADGSMVEAFASIHAELEAAGHKPKLHVLDNK